jgi:hypothetical protein
MVLAPGATVPESVASVIPLMDIAAVMVLPLIVPDNGPPGKQTELSKIDPVSAVPV